MTTIQHSEERQVSDELAERGVEVLRRLSVAKVSLSDASFIAEWVSEARATLRALPVRNTEVGVKALEWKENGSASIWTGELQFGVYYTIVDEGTGWRVFRHQFLSEASETEIAYVASVEAAKAVAQADFDQRIRSALTSLASTPFPAQTVTDEMVERACETDCLLHGGSWSELPAKTLFHKRQRMREILTAALSQHKGA